MTDDEQQSTSIPGWTNGQLCYLQIPALDITTSARFYEQVFGWSVDPPESGFEAPDLIGQWVTDRPPAPDGGPVAWIHVTDLHSTLEVGDDAGAALREGPSVDGPRLLASFTDPAGNLVGLAQHGRPRPLGPPEVNAPAARNPAISVMLIVPDAEAALAWYQDALGASELWNLGGVAGLQIDGAPFFLHQVNPDNPAERCPGQVGATSTRIELFVDDPDSFVRRAVAAGATPGSEIKDHQAPWGTHRQGGFHDPFGHNWSVGDRSPLEKWSRSPT